MARTVEQILRDHLGALLIENAKMAAELEHAREVIAELEKAKADAEHDRARTDGADVALRG